MIKLAFLLLAMIYASDSYVETIDSISYRKDQVVQGNQTEVEPIKEHKLFRYIENKIKHEFKIAKVNTGHDKYLSINFKSNRSKPTVDDCVNKMVNDYNPKFMVCSMRDQQSNQSIKCKCTLLYFSAFRIRNKRFYLFSNQNKSKWYQI